MPNSSRAKDKIHLAISMKGLSRVLDRYLRGCKHGLVLGDDLAADLRWCSEIERILIGSGYMTEEEIHKLHIVTETHWMPEYGTNYSPGDPNDPEKS